MEQGFLSQVGLPLAVVLMMVAMGLTLSVADFKRLLSNPRPVGLGLVNQLVLLPIAGFIVALIFPLEAVFAISLMMIAACPGGPMSNLIVHVAEADRALSITLTAISNMLAFLSVPLIVNFAIGYFSAGVDTISLPVLQTMLQIALLTVVPVIIGMFIRSRNPDFAERTKPLFKRLASGLMFVVIMALVIQNIDLIINKGPVFGPALIVLNALTMGIGYWSARLLKLNIPQSNTIMVETGVQNATLAITIALTLLNNTDMSIIPALYGLWMLITGFPIAWWLGQRQASPHAKMAMSQ
ncbi:MAG: bile acid:sodium symporter family protein [Ardenticatenaceae bacterium]